MSAPELLWVKGNYTGSQPSWKTVLWAVLQLWNGQSACDTANQPSEARTTREGQRPVNTLKAKAGQHGDVPPLWYVCLHNGQILMMCEHECSRFAPALSWFWCGGEGGILGRLLAALRTQALRGWEHTQQPGSSTALHAGMSGGPTPWPKTQRSNGACRLGPGRHFCCRYMAEIRWCSNFKVWLDCFW